MLVTPDIAPSWVKLQPARRNTVKDLVVAVQDLKDSETSGGWRCCHGRRLSTVRRELCTRCNDPNQHRSETNEVSAQGNYAMIGTVECTMLQPGILRQRCEVSPTCFHPSRNFGHMDANEEEKSVPSGEEDVVKCGSPGSSLQLVMSFDLCANYGGHIVIQQDIVRVEFLAQTKPGTGRFAHVHSVRDFLVLGPFADDAEELATFKVAPRVLRRRLVECQTLETTLTANSRVLVEMQTEHHETLVPIVQQGSPEYPGDHALDAGAATPGSKAAKER